MANNAPVIIKRIVDDGGHGHHGGAWKVAYADFVTAMMAFFLMLWLLSTSEEETLKGLAEYFSEATEGEGTASGGVGGILDGTAITEQPIVVTAPASPFSTAPSLPSAPAADEPDPFELDFSSDAIDTGDAIEAGHDRQGADLQGGAGERQRTEDAQFETARALLEQQLQSSAELAEYADSLMIDRTEAGLRVQIVDQARTAMFPAGGAEMFPHTRKLLEVVVAAIGNLPQKVSIRGHTDSRPFAAGSGKDNWMLSSERANATRKALVEAGLPADRIVEVIGKADSDHLLEEAPDDPRNRRISLVLLRERQPVPTP